MIPYTLILQGKSLLLYCFLGLISAFIRDNNSLDHGYSFE